VSIDDVLALDFVGRYESLEADFQRLLSEIGVNKPLALPAAKSSTRPSTAKDYRRFYDDESKEIVANETIREIETFGYVF
jgi:hypothetical protein